MYITDDKIENILYKHLEFDEDLSLLLGMVLGLSKKYSFEQNQTYPRPSHPNIEKRKDAYFTLVAVLISLRTTLENEMKAVDLFMKKYQNIDDVLNSNIEDLATVIKCAGMPLKKAQTIVNASTYIKNNFNGNILNLLSNNDINLIRNELLKIPGVGDKSADCMLELGFDLPSIVVDINVFRVISRMYDLIDEQDLNFNDSKQILMIKSFLEKILPKDYMIYQIVHTMILLHGKYVCKANPKCEQCQFYNKCKQFTKSNLFLV